MKRVIIPLALILILTSCGEAQKYTTKLRGANPDFTINNDEKISNEFIEFREKLAKFNSKFVSLYDQYREEKENYVSSPLSFYMALSLAIESTGGETRKQMLNSLDMSYDMVKNNTKTLYKISKVENEYIGTNRFLKEDVINSVWLRPDLSYNDECLNSLSQNYYSDLFEADFKFHNVEVNKDFREYVKDKTNGLIDKDFNFDINTAFLLTNILYLKDVWDVNKSLNESNSFDFKNYDGSIINQKFLFKNYVNGLPYKNDKFSSFYIPTASDYKLIFLVPNDNCSIDDVFTSESIMSILENINVFSQYCDDVTFYTDIYFPKFNVYSDLRLKDFMIEKLGITDYFNDLVCDYSPLVNSNVVCDDILQTANLNIDKNGIEGAAVTVHIAKDTAFPLEPTQVERFVVDRNFGYLICDKYNNVLFSGKIFNIE